MIIRTTIAGRAVIDSPIARPKLSDREKRRLDNTKHSEGKITPAIPKSIVKEEVRVEEDKTIEGKEENAVVAQPTVEASRSIAEPGTAMIRSKVLEELEKKADKPKKKYKIISIG